ncbi:MAG: hypothetical protein ABI200_04755 [Gaiellales bacterium]
MDPVAHHLGSRMRRVATRSVALLVLLAITTGVGTAAAAPTLKIDTGYTEAAMTCHQLGQSDETGVFYTTCGKKIMRYSRTGVALPDITVPAGINSPRDVAPSPDGKYLYVSQDGATPRRLNRTGAVGSEIYTLDATWKLQDFSVWNVKWTPVGRSLATDGRGDIYVSNGSFTTGSQKSIAKFKPSGEPITAFGDYGKEDGNWITNMDIAVSRDGRRVFVGENCGRSCIYTSPDYQGSRITRYDFNAGGTYRYSSNLAASGPMDGNPFPRCESAGAVHSGYSLALDFYDNLYVTSTTCGRIQMYATNADPARDRFVKTIATYTDIKTGTIVGIKNHYIASDWSGRLYANEWSRKFTPKTIKTPTLPLPALEPLPEPDTIAPVVKTITMPATTIKQDVQVAINATDARGVTEMQLAREDGNWGPWQPFSTPVTYRLSNGLGIKGVFVRVRDMAGNESNSVYRTIGFIEQPAGDGGGPVPGVPGAPDGADPILSALTIPAMSATQTIDVTVVATDDVGVTGIRYANEDGNWGEWQAYAATKPWLLSPREGMKVVFAQVRDAAGRESVVMSARTRYQLDAPVAPPGGGDQGVPDTVAPVLSGFTVPAETTTRKVTTKLVATDNVGLAQVRFANEDGNWTAWQAWSAAPAWTVSDGFGAKAIFAQVRDATGNESLVLTARTTYVRTAAGPVDQADPALVSVKLPETIKGRAVEVTLNAIDDIGVTEVRFANEDGEWLAWKPYGARVPHQLTVGSTYKVVYAQVRDAVGRESNVLFARTLVTD